MKPSLCFIYAIATVLGWMQLVSAQVTVNADILEEKPPLTISTDNMEYDMQNRTSNLEGNVRVADGEMVLTADAMDVRFDKENKVESIIATGNVKIIKTDETVSATGRRATYTVASGDVVITGDPILRQENYLVKGAERIVYNRNTQKAKTQGGSPKMEFYDKKGEGANALLPERK